MQNDKIGHSFYFEWVCSEQKIVCYLRAFELETDKVLLFHDHALEKRTGKLFHLET